MESPAPLPPPPPTAPQLDLGLLVPPFSTVVVCMSLVYGFGFGLVVMWTAHSIHKHGWCRRSLRRFSYLLFTLLLSVRLAWCLTLLLLVNERPETGSEALHTLSAITLGRAAYCVHFLAFSMLVCGWADSTYMMMASQPSSSGRSMQPAAMRTHSSLFYHIGPPFVAVNTINAILSFGATLRRTRP